MSSSGFLWFSRFQALHKVTANIAPVLRADINFKMISAKTKAKLFCGIIILLNSDLR